MSILCPVCQKPITARNDWALRKVAGVPVKVHRSCQEGKK